MPNLFEFADWLTMKGLQILLNKSEVAQFFNTDYNKEFTREFPVGETVRVPLPQRFLIRQGLVYSPQPINRRHTTITMNDPFGVDFEWDSVEQALNMSRGYDAIEREYLEPAMVKIANEIDRRCAFWAYQNTNHCVGSLGTTPTVMDPFLEADAILFSLSCPPGEKGMIVSPMMQQKALLATQNFFNPASDISKQYRDGSIGKYGGADWYRNNNLYPHTAGTQAVAANMQVFSAPATGASSIIISGGAGDTYKKGDIITFALVNECNPVHLGSTGRLKQFVVTQDLTMVGNNTDVLNFQPALDGPGSQYQNVTALPAAGAVITLWPGTTTPSGKSGMQGLLLHRDAFALVGVKLEMPKAVEIASQQRDPESGISIRFVRQFDGSLSKMVNRFDCLIGLGNLYPDNCAVRIASLL